MKILGTTTLTEGSKIVLISKVKEKLKAEKGDMLVYFEANNGDIIIKKG
jgi:hypothetical protein